MSSQKLQLKTNMSVELDEPLTSDGCLKLIMEFLKYILYNKQQIPFSYDSLAQVQAKSKPTDRNFMNIGNFLDCLCDVSNHLNSQFYTDRCIVKEIIIIIGATIFSPKFCISMELPENILNSKLHSEYHHSSRKPLLNLMRSIVDCDAFQEALNLPIGPTNTFVLVRKSDANQLSTFFIPKPQYSFPLQSSSFHIRLDHSKDFQINCRCSSAIKVFHDSRKEFLLDLNLFDKSNSCESTRYQWYQARKVIKGFKFFR
ncbi:MAD2L1-binding protein-like [Leptopilina boulardi]|uniref:MAD2L1-binding protein-like n=1 Tax=Leptopilina boulardi TaxID=63433 RepID=UPI0021F51161|nr:MAD2L1-binding protein-like [Leptopilina boulardi]